MVETLSPLCPTEIVSADGHNCGTIKQSLSVGYVWYIVFQVPSQNIYLECHLNSENPKTQNKEIKKLEQPYQP